MTFGNLADGVWGAAWFAGEPRLVVGTPGGNSVLTGGTLTGAEATEDWALAATGVELSITAAGEPIHDRFDGGADGVDQLCQVRGTVAASGAAVELACLGRRATRSGLDLSRYTSIRDVSMWFEPEEGVALTALRPRKAKHHGKDVVVAAVLDVADGKPVVDPRLSTTYDAEGAPRRVGLELWLEEENGDQFPRRTAAESTPPDVQLGDELRATVLRAHSRGREGMGVYLLATRPG
ncbi:MAG TPA: hypothetical protein VGI87_04260 [Solirubrobacteraceae bacterium]